MSLASVRSSIVSVVQGTTGVSGVAVVHDYLRLVTHQATLNSLFRDIAGTRVHFWCVTPAGADTLTLWEQMACDEKRYTFEIHGYYALDDTAASEKAFLTIAEAVFEAIRHDKRLGDTVTRASPVAWMTTNHVSLAEVLCHHVMFTLPVREHVD